MPKRPKTFGERYLSRQKSQKDYDRRRGKDRQFYGKTQWRRLRRSFLMDHPLCAECERNGRVKPATEVHHLIRRKERPALAFDRENLEALCKSCHSSETRKEQANGNS